MTARTSALAAAVLSFLALAAPANAQRPAAAYAAGPTSDRPPIEGVFVLDPSAGDAVESIIDRGVDLLSWYKRPFARGRLREATAPAAWVSIEPGPKALRVRTEVDDLTIPWEGGIPAWEWKPGDIVRVTAAWDGADLLQDFYGSDGTRHNRYVLDPDGRTLELLVRVESDQLAQPLRYRLVYVRQE